MTTKKKLSVKTAPAKKSGKEMAAQLEESVNFYKAKFPEHASEHNNTPFSYTADVVAKLLKTA